MNLAPIILFTYNRLNHTKKTIEALKANNLASESEIFIYSDAPKDNKAMKAVEEVRSYLDTVTGFKMITITKRNYNWGLADSIIDGVTTIINQYGKVIVLEDDIVTSTHFLQFMNDALELYKNEEKVMHISGYFFPVDTTNLPETFFYNQSSCWGWGTWSKAWGKIDTDIDSLLEKVQHIKNQNQYFKSCLSQLKSNKRGEIKTWAARWQASILLNRGYCLHPAVSYINNIGHDGTGVHSADNSVFSKEYDLAGKMIKIKPITITENHLAVSRANDFYKTLTPSLTKRIINIISRKIRIKMHRIT